MNFKKCTKCNKEFSPTLKYFYKKNVKSGLTSECISCLKVRAKLYIKNNKSKIKNRKHEYYEKYKDDIIKKTKEWRKEHPEKVKRYNKKYWKSNKGKNIRKKWDKIQYAKRKSFGYTELFPNPFNNNEEIDWHHINDEFIVAIPKDLHQLYGGNTNYHRLMCMVILNQIYMDKDGIYE